MGFEMKEKLKSHIQEKYSSSEIIDVGCYSADRCDYPDIAQSIVKQHLDKSRETGSHHITILVCGSGLGISIAANKWLSQIEQKENIQRSFASCSLVHDITTAKYAKDVLGSRMIAL